MNLQYFELFIPFFLSLVRDTNMKVRNIKFKEK